MPRFTVAFYPTEFGFTWPLIEFIPDEDRLTFRARFGLGLIFRPWVLECDQVRSICMTPRGVWPPGLEIWSTASDRWLVIAGNCSRLLAVLASMGYPVS